MKLCRFIDNNGKIRTGAEPDGGTAEEAVENSEGGFTLTGRQIEIRSFLAPVLPPAVLCIGLNYREHARETGQELPKYPVLFMKNPGSVTGHLETILLPESCRKKPQADFEAELAVIIGRSAKNVPAEQALSYVKGYTIGNDVSARSWQKHAGGGQWVRGKSFDTFCPLGPVLVSPEEIPDPGGLAISCRLNSEIMQESNTSDMIFSVPRLIEYLTEDTTLLPGTVILTGTPSGVGFARKPPVFLKPGDRIEIEIEGIGKLVNTVGT